MGVAAMLEILVGGGNKVKTKEKGKNPSPVFPLSPEEPQLQICRLDSGKKAFICSSQSRIYQKFGIQETFPTWRQGVMH